MAQISQNQMAKLFQRLATSYRAGIDLRTSIKRESQTGSPAHQQKMKRVAKALDGGGSLAKALSETQGYFPELVVSVVKAGETGGRLDDSFNRLGKHYKDLVEFINWFWMGSTIGNVIAYYVLAALFFTTVGLAITGVLRGWFGATPLRLAMRIPLIGSTIRCLALSRFCWTMSVAENAGMSALAGNQFYPTFLNTNAFPDELLVQMENGETAGQLSESMALASEEYQLKAEANLKAIGKIGMVLMMLMVAGVVAFIAIFGMSQYLNLINDLARPNAFK